MKFLIRAFFILSILVSNAQTEQIDSTKETSAEVACSQTVKGEIRDKKTNNLLGDAIVTLSDEAGNTETQMVKEDALFSFSIKCGTSYKIEARKTDYTLESKDFITSDETDKELKLVILLDKGNIDFVTDAIVKKEEKNLEVIKPVEKSIVILDKTKQTKSCKFIVSIDPIYFDFKSSYLNKNAKIELQNIVDILNQYPKMVIKIASHADAQGSDKTNNWFADRRAKRTLDFIVKNGIDSSRITTRGFGETQLRNECGNGVDCKEAKHAQNRRVEFVVVSM